MCKLNIKILYFSSIILIILILITYIFFYKEVSTNQNCTLLTKEQVYDIIKQKNYNIMNYNNTLEYYSCINGYDKKYPFIFTIDRNNLQRKPFYRHFFRR